MRPRVASSVFLVAIMAGILALPGSSTARAQGPDLVANGGFESGALSPWEGDGPQITSADVHSGSYAARVTAGDLSQGWFSVDPTRTYVLIAWFKWVQFDGEDWGYDMIRVVNSDWSDAAGVSFLHRKYERGLWHKLALTFTPNGSAVLVSMGMYGPQDTVEMYFDDIQLFEKAGNLPPSASPTASVSSGSAPLTVQFAAHADDPDGAVQSYQWDFGDGGAATIADPSHTFVSRGTYLVTLSVWDNEGAVVTQTLTISVSDASSPSVTISAPTDQETYNTSSAAVVLGGAASAPGSTIKSLVWDNLNTGDAGFLNVSPSPNLSWTTPSISLKAGKNEILVTATDSRDCISTDRIIVTRLVSGPQIANVRLSASEVRVFEKFEVRFDLDTVAEAPFFLYDEAPPPGIPPKLGVTVEGVFVTPSGNELRQPGYLTVDVVRSETGSTVRYQETPERDWVVRFSPQETGRFSVSLSVHDASGSTMMEVGEFTATSPTRSGFIRVSQADPRYFEFSNGDLYWPIGPAWAVEYSALQGTGLNFERPWMGGTGAYSTNWARWISSSERHGNEGVMTHFSFRDRYPGHDLSYELFYPEGFRYWLTPWSDDSLAAHFESGATYQVKVRFKTVDISGPRNASYPYGFAIRHHGFLSHDTSIEEAENALRDRPKILDHVAANQDWHTMVFNYVVPANMQAHERDDISLYLDNVTGGRVLIDEFSIRKVLPGGGLGGELIRNPRADEHTYVDPRAASYLDWQVTQGDTYGVYFKYVVFDKNDWVPNHLLANGSFSDYGGGYYQPDGTKARWLLQQWWRYLVARWGYSTAVHSWELNNEGPPDDGSGAHARAAQDFARFMHENDAHPHLASTSFWCCWEPSFWGDHARFPDIGYADWHRYTESQAETDDVARFVTTISQTVGESNVRRPTIIAETGIFLNSGPIPELNSPNPGLWYHDLLWAQLHWGSASFPNYWDRAHLESIESGIQTISKPFSEFVQALDVNEGGYAAAAADTTNALLRTLGQKNLDRNKAYLWIQNRQHTWRNVMENPGAIAPQSGTITLGMNPNVAYQVTWWDTYAGQTIKTETVTSDGSGALALSVSGLRDDVAVIAQGPDAPRPTFADVPFSHPYHDVIEALYQAGYTAGCNTNPLMYCPESTMNRAESAVFVERGIHGTTGLPPQPTTQTFADLPLDSWAAKWAEALWQDGYTAGCGTDPLVYCPWQGHTRAEGCVFYLHMLNGATYAPPQPSQQTFADVPLDTWYAKWVQAAFDAGLIEACQTTPELRFCPDDPLSRALAADMMVRAKGIPLP